MTPEMTVLLLLPILGLAYVASGGMSRIVERGFRGVLGARDDLPAIENKLGQRGERANHNFKESLPWAVALLALVQMTGLANETSALGAWLYFYARIAYLAIYLAGVPWLRTMVWGLSIAGLVMVAMPVIEGGQLPVLPTF